MKLREFRQVLHAIVLAGLPAAGCDSSEEPTCTPQVVRESVELDESAAPSLRLKVERCRVDAGTCLAMCEALGPVAPNSLVYVTACAPTFFDDHVSVDVTYNIIESVCSGVGRRPAGLLPARVGVAASAAGQWLAHAAWLEAASVHAFTALARQLTKRGAPRRFIAGALAAAADEVRHAALMTELALRWGVTPAVPEVIDPGDVALEELALDNAVEGCVRETWAAILAQWQARTAPDPALRAAFAVIARDELRHAALAWSMEPWLAEQIDPAAAQRVRVARDAAIEELLAGHHTIAALGLPDPVAARQLWSRAHASLWTGVSR